MKLLSKFDEEELWYLDQIIQSPDKEKLLLKIKSNSIDLDDEMTAFIKGLKEKVKKLTDCEVKELFDEMCKHSYMPN